jgi:hypothetical protein
MGTPPGWGDLREAADHLAPMHTPAVILGGWVVARRRANIDLPAPGLLDMMMLLTRAASR